jgi:hypothetical protein
LLAKASDPCCRNRQNNALVFILEKGHRMEAIILKSLNDHTLELRVEVDTDKTWLIIQGIESDENDLAVGVYTVDLQEAIKILKPA